MRLDKMKEGGYFLQNFALFVYASRGESYFEKAMAMADCFDRQMALFADEICQVRSWKEIEENSRTGKMSALILKRRWRWRTALTDRWRCLRMRYVRYEAGRRLRKTAGQGK